MAAMGKPLITSILLFSLTLPAPARTQFFDFYPSISLSNPFQYEITPPTLLINRRPQDFYLTQSNNRRNQNNHQRTNNVRTTRTTSTTEKYDEEILNVAVNKHIPFSSFINKPGSESNIYSLINNYNNVDANNHNGNSFTSSTSKPVSTTRRNSNINNNQRKVTSTEASIHIQYSSDNRNNDNKEIKVNNENNKYSNNNFNVNSNNNDDRDNNYSINNNERNIDKDNKRVNTNQGTQRNPNVNNYDTHKNNNILDDNNYNRRPFDDITTKSPYKNYNFNYNEDNRPYNNQRTTQTTTSRASYTSQTSFQTPGVKPAVYDGPPITNKPTVVTDNPYKTRGYDGVSFPEDNDGPVLMTGPDVDRLNDAQRRRLYNLADKTCDRWRALNLKQVQAIPLLPSPDAVRVNVTECAAPTPLIVGGRGVSIEQFPHQAAVGWRKREGSGYSWKCGGTLISELYVMTAAHCTYQERDEDVDTGPPQAVQLGSTYLDGRNALVFKVAAAIRHPNYKLPKSYFDVALLKLTSQVRFSNAIRPACLGEPPTMGEKIVAAGWGRTEFGGDQSKELRAVSVTVWDMSQCRNALGTSRKLPEGVSSESQFCAGEKRGGKDTCQGDSGGAALVRSGCVWVACGVTSLGRGCGSANVPAVYARANLPFVASVAFT